MHKRTSKRKAERRQSPQYTQPDPTLYILAHEAEIIRGPHVNALASSLEGSYAESGSEGIKTRLVAWNPSSNRDEGSKTVWVDRYDVRLLLDALPPPPEGEIPQTDSARLSPTGWSDLPSDAEDTFFFSPDEAEDYHREKRRRLIDQSREERLRALHAEPDDVGDDHDDDPWGGSDEEPDETQRELMRRTATHILNSPNPAQLEMRILANHGADRRFSFLRGRWSRAWKTTKGHIRLEMEAEKNSDAAEQVGLGGLAGYGDSDASEEEAEVNEGKGVIERDTNSEVHNPETDTSRSLTEEALKEARRAKARAWAEQRKAAQQNETV